MLHLRKVLKNGGELFNMIEDECYDKAIELLKKNSITLGFKASESHYNAIYARDGCIASLGACLTQEKDLVETSRRTLATLKKYATELGQIPNLVTLKGVPSWGRSGSTDASLWYVIAAGAYFSLTEDKTFLKTHWSSIKKAINWLKHQDQNNMGLIDSVEGGEWMDSTILRSGKVLYCNVLWYKCLQVVSKLSDLMREKITLSEDEIKVKINKLFWPEKGGERALGFTAECSIRAYNDAIKPNREFYCSHVILERYADLCDTLANCLTIIFDVADEKKKGAILKYFERRKLSEPYPIRALDPPITKPNLTWWKEMERYKRLYHRSNPYSYGNAGIWPYIGGFYLLALLKVGEREKALEELRKLAEANKIGNEKEWEFNEWLHGKTGEPMGQIGQSWNAGAFLMAYEKIFRNKDVFEDRE